MNWIDVKEEVPDTDRNVLFYGKDKEVWIASLDAYGNWWVDEYGIVTDVIKWMELPKVDYNEFR